MCDVLVIAGDICPATNHSPGFQRRWLAGPFRRWLDAQPAKHVVATLGNHDFIGEKAPELIPDLRWNLLLDQSVTIEDLNFYGTPWQPRFLDWAFNLDPPELAAVHRKIPNETDVLICHGPPFGFGDTVRSSSRKHLGAQSLTDAIRNIQPSLAVVGHIHGGRGSYRIGLTTLLNASVLDEGYHPVFRPWLIEMNGPVVTNVSECQ